MTQAPNNQTSRKTLARFKWTNGKHVILWSSSQAVHSVTRLTERLVGRWGWLQLHVRIVELEEFSISHMAVSLLARSFKGILWGTGWGAGSHWWGKASGIPQNCEECFRWWNRSCCWASRCFPPAAALQITNRQQGDGYCSYINTARPPHSQSSCWAHFTGAAFLSPFWGFKKKRLKIQY